MTEISLNSDGSTSEVDIRAEVKKRWPYPQDVLAEMQAHDSTTYRVVSDFGNAILEQFGPDAARCCVEGMSIVWAIQRMKPRVVVPGNN